MIEPARTIANQRPSLDTFRIESAAFSTSSELFAFRCFSTSRHRMPRTIPFHLDEDVAPVVAHGLRLRAFDSLALIWELCEPDELANRVEYI
jgi:hypothetical protein